MPRSTLAALAEGLVSANLTRITAPTVTLSEAVRWMKNSIVLLSHATEDPKQWRIWLFPADKETTGGAEWDLLRGDESVKEILGKVDLGSLNPNRIMPVPGYEGGWTGKITLVHTPNSFSGAKHGAVAFTVRDASRRLGPHSPIDQVLEFWQETEKKAGSTRTDLVSAAYGDDPVDPKVLAGVHKLYSALYEARLQADKLLNETDFPRKSKVGGPAAEARLKLAQAENAIRRVLEAAGEDLA